MSRYWEGLPLGQVFVVSVNMNDVWGWACADAADINLGEWEDRVAMLYKQFGYDGIIAYVAKRDDLTPQPPVLKLIGREKLLAMDAALKQDKA